MKKSSFSQVRQIIQSFEKNITWNKENCQKAVDFYIELLAMIERQISLLNLSIDNKKTNIINNNNDLVLQEIDFFTMVKNTIMNAFFQTTGKRPQEVRAFIVADNYNEKKLSSDIVKISSTLIKSHIYG